MQCNFKAAASLADYSNGTTWLKSSSKFSPSSAIQSLSMSNCVCTVCALVKRPPFLACLHDTYAPALEKLQYWGAELSDSTISESSTFRRPSIARSSPM